MRCHALVALLEHPVAGFLLFDTGYSQRRMQEAIRQFPYRLYRHAAPFFTTPDESAAAQISHRFGFAARAVRTVILSHFHPDHLSGLGDFPQARVVASREAYAAIADRRGVSALARGFLPDLLPSGFTDQADLLPSGFTGKPLPHLGPTHDLLGDGLLRLVYLPGHAHGQIGLLAATHSGPVFFVADAAYTRRSIRENRPPHRVTNLFTEGEDRVAETLRRLHDFARERPDVVLVPTHCPEAFEELVNGK